MKPPFDPRASTLVRVPSWLGDLVMAEPVLRAAWEAHGAVGNVEGLTLAGPGPLLELLDGALPGARRLATGGEGRAGEGWAGHHTALLLVSSFRSAWTAWRARIPNRVGWIRDGRGALLTHGMRPAREVGRTPLGLGVPGRRPRILPRPFGATCVQLATFAGLRVQDRGPRLAATGIARERVAGRLAALGLGEGVPWDVANVGARPGSAKGYPPELWARALDELACARARPVVLACGPGEEPAAEAVAGAVERADVRPLVAPPVALPELVALFERAALVLTADAGPRHVAVAVGTPVAVVCGPTDPRHTADWLDGTLVVRTPVPCGPCHRERCPLPAGPGHHACMRRVEPERLAGAALALSHYDARP